MTDFHIYVQRLKTTRIYFKEFHSFIWDIPANVDEQTPAKFRQRKDPIEYTM